MLLFKSFVTRISKIQFFGSPILLMQNGKAAHPAFSLFFKLLLENTQKY